MCFFMNQKSSSLSQKRRKWSWLRLTTESYFKIHVQRHLMFLMLLGTKITPQSKMMSLNFLKCSKKWQTSHWRGEWSLTPLPANKGHSLDVNMTFTTSTKSATNGHYNVTACHVVSERMKQKSELKGMWATFSSFTSQNGAVLHE